MKRKDFIKKTLMAGTLAAAGGAVARASNIKPKTSDYDKMKQQIGFNHLPNKETRTVNTVLHPANTRGYANHGWLQTHHSFSFANYYNPDRMNFGVLRVLNDDDIAPGRGFSTHPHDNMEIITIPLEGDLAHKDSMSNAEVIKEGDIQVMSAGKGIFHSEFNHNADKPVRLFQIWVFPNKKNVEPRYDQVSLKDVVTKEGFNQILSPNPNDQGVWIHQDAWFNMGRLSNGNTYTYNLNKATNGVYAFVVEGQAEINGQKLESRDALGIWDVNNFDVKAHADTRLLLLEVPMQL